ncbi:MAG: helix-turn-helix domain-containing protein [Caulobacteraceae bacterium]
METPLLTQIPALLDLSRIEAPARAGLWASTATSCFPGLTIDAMPSDASVGQMQSIPMGGGALWSIVSAPVLVSYSPVHVGDDSGASISLLLQLDGVMTVGQNHRVCRLEAGDMCLVDERFGFYLQGEVCSHIVFLRMPRRAVLGRHPYLEHCTARVLDSEDPGAQLLRDTLTRAVQAAPDLREEQRGSVLAAMVHLLGAATAPRGADSDEAPWRVRAALAVIETHLGDADLTAERVAEAQGVSRRRLDQVLRRALGRSVTAHIWSRRLEQAAADLTDPRYQGRAVSQIAFANGFEDAAHFSRAFKGRFGRTPRDWRIGGAAH